MAGPDPGWRNALACAAEGWERRGASVSLSIEPPASEPEIRRTEKKIGRLPPEFRRLLLRESRYVRFGYGLGWALPEFYRSAHRCRDLDRQTALEALRRAHREVDVERYLPRWMPDELPEHWESGEFGWSLDGLVERTRRTREWAEELQDEGFVIFSGGTSELWLTWGGVSADDHDLYNPSLDDWINRAVEGGCIGFAGSGYRNLKTPEQKDQWRRWLGLP